MAHLKIKIGVSLLFFSISLSAHAATLCEQAGFNHEYLNLVENVPKRIEYCWAAPSNLTELPVVILVHGHQEPERPGADFYVRMGLFQKFLQQGYVTVAISQPGYGNSDGPPDFSGPVTQEAIIAVADYFRSLSIVNPQKIALWGFSRGAIAVGMVLARNSNFAAAALGSGIYDLGKVYRSLPDGNELKNNILNETGGTPSAFRDRSALKHSNSINVPLLLGAGGHDEVAPFVQAFHLAEDVGEHFGDVKFVFYPTAEHPLNPDWISETFTFFRKRLLAQ